jgi:UDP-N-acetyl-D-mannosaminuronic acid transferase (WecB/TagA/CpsF family)
MISENKPQPHILKVCECHELKKGRQTMNDYIHYDSIGVKVKSRQTIYNVVNQASNYSWWDVMTEREHEGIPGVLGCSVS